jgi:hypothetical protein
MPFRLLSPMDYYKFTDWLKGLHELLVDVRERSGSYLIPVHAKLESSGVR